MTNGWRLARFDEILTKVDRKFIIDDGQEYNCVGVRWYGNGAFIRERQLGAEINRKQQWILKAGDVVYNKLFAWKNAFAVADESVDGCIVSDKFPTYHIKPDLIDPRYLAYYFTTPQIGIQAQNLSKGAAAISKLTLNPPQFWDLTIPLPPLNEQRRIAERIETLTIPITKAYSLREDAQIETVLFLKSCLSSIFDYEYGDELPTGWEWKSFDQTLVQDGMRTGPFGTALNNSEIYTEGIPVFGIPNVGNSVFRPGFTDYVTEEKAKSLSVYVLEEGDIAIARSGTVGRSCIVPKLDPKPIMSSNLIRIRIDKKVFLPDLMCQILTGSKLVERHIDKECRGSTRIFFTQKILNKFQIPVPPLDEQRRIVAYLDSVQARLASLRELQSQTQEELDALLPSVLDKAFKGEL